MEGKAVAFGPSLLQDRPSKVSHMGIVENVGSYPASPRAHRGNSGSMES